VQRRELSDESKTTAATDGHIFHQADPRHDGRLDDKQGGDNIVTIERVREAIAFRLSGKNLGMIGHFLGWVRKLIARSVILKCGVSRENLKT